VTTIHFASSTTHAKCNKPHDLPKNPQNRNSGEAYKLEDVEQLCVNVEKIFYQIKNNCSFWCPGWICIHWTYL